MKKMKNNLDERQEQILLKIEHNGCWLAFTGLIIAIIVQQLFFGAGIKQLAGEWCVFMLLCIYMLVECIRNGIWDRHLKPNAKTNLLISVLTALVMGVVMFVYIYMRFPDAIIGSVASGIFSAILIFVLAFATLTIFSNIAKKRAEKLEKETEEDIL